MIVPQFWAEGRTQHRAEGRQTTVRRFGWSDVSVADAQSMADTRAKEALDRILSGEKLSRRDLKRAYNGADGVPIREEIVARHGETIITRNSYGARCLNTPNVLIADVDHETSAPGLWVAVATIALLAGEAWFVKSAGIRPWQPALVPILCFTPLLGFILAEMAHWLLRRSIIKPERWTLWRVRRFFAKHPEWGAHLYRTPAGLRVLVTHQPFLPDNPAVAECFRLLRADPIYVLMCQRQRCFRARVSPKPWRMGIHDHLRPRRSVWPLSPDQLEKRNTWVRRYEDAAHKFAACSLLEVVGSSVVHPEVRPVQLLHDELCRTASGLPIA